MSRESRTISCEELTREIAYMTNRINQLEKELNEKNAKLKQTEIALNVLLDNHKNVRCEVKQQTMLQLKKLVLPYVDLLSQCTSSEKKKKYLAIITSRLHALADSFTEQLTHSGFGLTKREILVADLIRNGKKTKEIAELLDLSPRSIEAYRNNVRKKCNLTGKKISLKRYLTSTFPPES